MKRNIWDIPCYAQMPDPHFMVEINDGTGDFEVPVLLLPEEILSKRLRRQSVRVYVFLGFMAPPGNIKRIPAGYMIDKAFETGLILSGDTVVEMTSGNMGVSLAFCAKNYGIRVVAIVSDSLPPGKLLPLQRHGAEVVKESEAIIALGFERSPGSIVLTGKYAEKIGGVFLNQYGHPWNPESYAVRVAPQLWEGIGEEASLFVSAVGSTGTLLGLGRYFKERCPRIVTIATMPYLGQNIDGTRDEKRLEEISHDWRSLNPIEEPIDEITARAVSAKLNENGIPAGPSSGAALGTAEHYLLTRLARGELDEMRGGDGAINVILPFADTLYPYG